MAIKYIGKFRAVISAYRVKPWPDTIKSIDPRGTIILFYE